MRSAPAASNERTARTRKGQECSHRDVGGISQDLATQTNRDSPCGTTGPGAPPPAVCISESLSHEVDVSLVAMRFLEHQHIGLRRKRADHRMAAVSCTRVVSQQRRRRCPERQVSHKYEVAGSPHLAPASSLPLRSKCTSWLSACTPPDARTMEAAAHMARPLAVNATEALRDDPMGPPAPVGSPAPMGSPQPRGRRRNSWGGTHDSVRTGRS